MDLMENMLPQVQAYIDGQDWRGVAGMQGCRYTASPLAQGEYNLNYLMNANPDGVPLVFRVNIGTQIDRSDQIDYEYRTLKLLENSGVTPRPFFVDDSRERLDHGVLIMAYLPGEPLDYTRDREAAAHLFATVHQIRVAEERNHLIREDAPLSLIFNESKGLLQHFFDSDLADEDLRRYLGEVLLWAAEARRQETYYQADPWYCIINTEVNSGNFIVDRKSGCIYLVDWEMPRWGDPSQDLSHFCSPLTTLWKTNYRMTPAEKKEFTRTYSRSIGNAHQRDTLQDRIRLRDPFVYLRGISWSAMGWVAYQTEFAGMKNSDTWRTLQRYMDLAFIRSLFDPFMRS